MKVQIEKGMLLRIFVYIYLKELTFKTEIFEFETDFIYDYEPDSDFKTVHQLLQLELNYYKRNQDFIKDGELVIDNYIFDSFYKKIFDLFINSYGSIDDWEQGLFILELQALDLNRIVVFQTEGFVNYDTIEGKAIL